MMGGKRKLEEGGSGGGGSEDDATLSVSKLSWGPDGGGAVVEDQSKKVTVTEVDNVADLRAVAGDGDASRIVTRETNPLVNEVILEHLFSHMPVALLASSRLVCRLWRDAARSSWHSSAAPRIIHFEYGPFPNGRTGTSIQEFMLFAEANGIILYRQFRLERWRLEESRLDFWELAGSKLTKLTLENCTTSKSLTLYKIINKFCPNLETLVLSTCEFGGYTAWQEKLNGKPQYRAPAYGEHPNLKSLHISSTGGNFLSTHSRLTYPELLAHFPHLTSLNLESGCWRGSSSATEVLDFLRVVKLIRRQDPRKLPIKKLGGFKVIVNELPLQPLGRPPAALTITELLQELGLPPLTFRLTDKLTLIEINHLVAFSGDGIGGLEVDWYSPSQPRTDFPFGVQLPSLEHLRMPEGFCKDFEFIKHTPNLKSLVIWVDYIRCAEPVLPREQTALISSTSKTTLARTQLLNLSRLELDNFTVGLEDLRWLVKWMPRVKNLTMILNDQQFPIVCENWQELVELKVMGEGLTDQGVSGKRKLEHPMTTRSGLELTRWETKTSPNIASLQNLEVFVAPNAIISDGTLLDILVKIRPLRRLFYKDSNKIFGWIKDVLTGNGIKISKTD